MSVYDKLRDLLNTVESNEDLSITAAIRPSKWEEFVGYQEQIRQVRRLLDAANARKEAPDAMLFVGPPGTGKTTIARLCGLYSNRFFEVLGGDTNRNTFRSMLQIVSAGDMFFIDEVHEVNDKDVSILYTLIEDNKVSWGMKEQNLPPFGIIASTTDLGSLPKPLIDRFGLIVHFSFYEHKDMEKLAAQSGHKLGMVMSDYAATQIAYRSRGVPRLANRMVRRLRDWGSNPTNTQVDSCFEELGVDIFGLDNADRRYLDLLSTRFDGGPVGLSTLALTFGEPEITLRQYMEPYLLRRDMIESTPRGRKITKLGLEYLKIINE